MDFYFEDGNTSIRGHSLESPLPSRSVLDNGHEILRDLSPSLEGHTGDFQSNLSLLEDSERPNMEQPSTAFNDDVLPSLPLPLLGQEITSSQALPSLSSDYGDPIGYEDLLELSPTFRRLHANNTPVVLDLTDTPSTQGPKQSGKRSAGSSTCERSAKLARTGSSLDTHSASINFCEEQIDVVDLRESDTVAQWEENKKKEAADAIQAQNQEATRPIKLSSFQCIICMDSPTDLAITHCGMFQALLMRIILIDIRPFILLRMSPPSSLFWREKLLSSMSEYDKSAEAPWTAGEK